MERGPAGMKFDRLLKAMASGEPHKAETKKAEHRQEKKAGSHSPPKA